MVFLVGTDEAGYGPNLGPLVVSVSVWQAPDESETPDLYDRLAGAIVRAPRETSERRVAVADSKRLYSPGGGLRHLERGLFAALRLLRRPTDRWREVLDSLDPDSIAARRDVPWLADYDEPTPIDAAAAEIEPLATALEETLAAAGARLIALRSRAVFEREFNRLVTRFDSKGHALSHVTLTLLADQLRALPDGPVCVVCDKHGGRDRYGALLTEYLFDGLVEVRQESRAVSRYVFGPRERRVDVAFQAKGEAWLPAAMASMASKYCRELAMRALNAFWSARVPGLRPTAGYPQDAVRFRAEIAAAQAVAGVADDMLWRNR